MRIKSLGLKRAFRAALFVLLLTLAGQANATDRDIKGDNQKSKNYNSYWSDFNEDSFDDMSPLVAFVQIEGVFVEAAGNWEDLEIAAFVGNECRGHTFMFDGTEVYGDPHPIIELSILFNSDTPNEEVSFKMYDHAQGRLYEDCFVNVLGNSITILTGIHHVEEYFNFDEAVILSFPLPRSYFLPNLNDYNNQKLVVAFIQIDNNYVTVEGNWENMEIAAFVGDECRGHAFMVDGTEVSGDPYPIVELPIYYNDEGEEVTFQMYDHENEMLYKHCFVNIQGEPLTIHTGEEHMEEYYNPSESVVLSFYIPMYLVEVAANPVEGGVVEGAGAYAEGQTCTLTAIPSNFYIFTNWTKDGVDVSADPVYSFIVTEAVSVVANFKEVFATQTVALTEGWNWFSSSVTITLSDLQNALMEALPGTPIMIKSKGYSTFYNGVVWRGTLNSLDVTQMYKIKTDDDCEIVLADSIINPANHPVTIHNGANWIGFPLREELSLSNAFDGFVTNGDMVRSKTTTATYNGSTWRGTLKKLVPGKGYVYMSAASDDRTFTFPADAK